MEDTAPRTHFLFKIFDGKSVLINCVVNSLHSITNIGVVGCICFGSALGLTFRCRCTGRLMGLFVDFVTEACRQDGFEISLSNGYELMEL